MPSAGQRNFTGRVSSAWNAGRAAFGTTMASPGARFNQARGLLRGPMNSVGGRFGMTSLAGVGALRSLGAARNRFRRGEYARGVGNLAVAGGMGYLGYNFARGNAQPAVSALRRGFAFGGAAKAFLRGLR